MTSNAPVFPTNRREIADRLTEPQLLEHLEAWTCDQAAQVLSGIDPDGFNQADADIFEWFSCTLNSCLIANTIESFESGEKKYLKPLAVLAWGIARANYEDYKLPAHIPFLYERINDKQRQMNAPIESAKEKQVNERELTQWLRETWDNEKRPGGTAFFNRLKKHVNVPGSPVTEHYSAGKYAGIKWRTSTGTTGEMVKKTIQTKVSLFKKSQKDDIQLLEQKWSNSITNREK